jgi:predicted transcriptional regulator
VQHAVLSFIYDRTDRYNKRWEIVSIKQITDGIFTADDEIVHQGIAISRTTAINAINALLEQDLIHRRPKKRLGSTWYEYSINWALLQEAAAYFHTDPFEEHEDWGN